MIPEGGGELLEVDAEMSATTQVAPPSRDPGRFAPIFVLAPARSFTSVITMMVGQHPELAGLPELKLFAYPTLSELEASLPKFWTDRGVTHRSPGLVRAFAQALSGSQTRESVALARGFLARRARWSGASILDLLMERLLPRVCIEKSPENVENDAALARLSAAYPRARYLHLTRHPMTTQQSLQRHLDRTFPDRDREGEVVAAIGGWYGAHCRILQLAASLPAERYLRLRSEDVVNDPRLRLGQIARWLGVRDDDAALEAMTHPEDSPFACFGPAGSGVTGGGDPGFLGDPALRAVPCPPALSDAPQGWTAGADAWRSVIELANRLGYA